MNMSSYSVFELIINILRNIFSEIADFSNHIYATLVNHYREVRKQEKYDRSLNLNLI